MPAAILADPNQWAALGINVATSTVVFMRRVLVLNKYTRRPHSVHAAAYFLSLLSGVLFWVGLNAVRDTASVQLFAGLLSTVLFWAILVLLVNQSLALPTRQQWASFVLYGVTEVGFLLQVRLVLSDASPASCR